MSIKIDKEFESLIPPLSDEEFAQLEENCVKEGIRDSLILWYPEGEDDGILIDGHNRFKISAKHSGMPFNIKRMQFKDRDEVKAWIIQNQFGRRNLSKYDRSILALKLKPIIAEKAKENERKGGGSGNSGRQKSDNPTITSKELAKLAGVSHDTIHRVEVIEQKASEKLKQQVRSGEKSINEAYLAVTPKPKTTAQEIKEAKARHEEFQRMKTESNTVSFRDAKEDAWNVKMIGRDFYNEILRATHKVYELTLFRNQTDIDATLKTYSAADRAELGRKIDETIMTLQFLKRKITEVK